MIGTALNSAGNTYTCVEKLAGMSGRQLVVDTTYILKSRVCNLTKFETFRVEIDLAYDALKCGNFRTNDRLAQHFPDLEAQTWRKLPRSRTFLTRRTNLNALDALLSGRSKAANRDKCRVTHFRISHNFS